MSGSSSTMRIFWTLTSSLFAGLLKRSSLSVLFNRQRKCKPAAAAQRALHLHRPAMGLHDVLHQGQAQAAALGLVHQAVLGPVELLEDPLLLVLGDADAPVADRQQHAPVLALELQA